MSCDLSLSVSDCGGGGGGGGGDDDDDDDNEDDGDDDRATLDVLAYGGEDGIISLLPRGEKGGATIVTLRRSADEVRALAVFPDGLRVAVGFDDGSTKVYSYDGWSSRRRATTTTTIGGGGGRRHHPFAEPPKSSSSSRGARDDDDDDDGLFLTQGDEDYDGDDGDVGGAKVYDGPRMDAPVHHVAFDPCSGTSIKGKGAGGSSSERFPYFLAIASKSGNSPVAIADVTDEYTAGDAARVRLAGASGDEHWGGGVRSVAYSPLPAPSDHNDDDDDEIVLLASMEMASPSSRPPLPGGPPEMRGGRQ